MPMIWIPQAELRALQAVLLRRARVDWQAYDRSKLRLLYPQQQPGIEPVALECSLTNTQIGETLTS